MDGEIKDLQCPTSKEFPFYSLDFQINLVLYQVPTLVSFWANQYKLCSSAIILNPE